MPAFARDGSVAHDYLWWYHIGNRAIRVGDWKLVAADRSPWELYDLRNDRCESNNLAAEHPDKVKELEAAWTQRAEEFRALALKTCPRGRGAPRRRKHRASEPAGLGDFRSLRDFGSLLAPQNAKILHSALILTLNP